jgi:hypothetical protein
MPSDVFVSEHAIGVVRVYQGDELVEGGVKGAKVEWGKGVSLGPVRATLERRNDGFEAGEVFAVGCRFAVRSTPDNKDT